MWVRFDGVPPVAFVIALMDSVSLSSDDSLEDELDDQWAVFAVPCWLLLNLLPSLLLELLDSSLLDISERGFLSIKS